MKTGNLCEVKLVDESIIPEGKSQKNMSKLTPKLFSIFEHQKPKIEILDRGILESCDITEILPNSDNTCCAQDWKARTLLGGKQPIEGLWYYWQGGQYRMTSWDWPARGGNRVT